MEWWFAVAALAIGAGAGFFIGRGGDRVRKRADELQLELDSVNNELNEYRGNVTRHFSRTAELVDALAANSREIYNHLATGSEQLCDPGAVRMKQDKREALQANTPVVESAEQIDSTETFAAKPEEGWYEIMPESDERKVKEPAL